MQEDFHYYATYSAAYLAGYSHEESLEICYSAQLVDHCSRPFLAKIGGPKTAATTQLQLEMMDAITDRAGLQDITRIWASFHFLPYDLYANVKKGRKKYKNKYRLICNPNGELLEDTVRLARGRSLQAAGLAMHVLADTWAHRYFAGTPSLVINNTDFNFRELIPEGEGFLARRVSWKHSVKGKDDPEKGKYINTVYQSSENSVMNLGHGRAGHLPDYSYARYKYLPAWGGYGEIRKDNPADYYQAFAQMTYALGYLHGSYPDFERDTYEEEKLLPYQEEIKAILEKRQIDSSEEWKAFGEKLSGCEIPAFDLEKWQEEYIQAEEGKKNETFLGRFILAALLQKSMVTEKIYRSGNRLAGKSIGLNLSGFERAVDFLNSIMDSVKEELDE